eukprot:CAMPEP_0198210474 /NCGR_PEP_ID=MMETSP1445-20131203/20128_1 /TAXON_ID=36898 /ORGANISM="Pyramimonas sp., Strain CCMP2087" /LENGTH=47 /DNA_ID= /DNA_START= /DNA_END= /DNA_ORIENTATION=
MTGCINSEFNYIENLTVSQKLVFPCKTHIDDAPGLESVRRNQRDEMW